MRCGVGDYTRLLVESLSELASVQVAVLTSVEAAAADTSRAFAVFAAVRTWTLRGLPAMLRVAREWRPDVIHVQFPTQGYGATFFPWFLPLIYRLCGYRVVQTWHENYTRIGPRVILPFIAKAAAPGGLVVVRPNYTGNTMRAWRWAFRNKVVRFIPNASVIPEIRLSDVEAHELRSGIHAGIDSIVVYFGFSHPAKRVELLFEIADPSRHRLVIIGEILDGDPYHDRIRQLARSDAWRNKVEFTGFLEATAAARLIAAADAVVLPFKDGGGEWNTSIHSAQAQRTFVLTTSRERRGFDANENTYYAVPDDVAEMKSALLCHIGHKRGHDLGGRVATWAGIANAHVDLYNLVIGQS
jgi:glycosyltransferase involved in cell wall biosynthesis